MPELGSDTSSDSDVSEEALYAVSEEMCKHNCGALNAMSAEKYNLLKASGQLKGTCNSCGKEGHWARDCPDGPKSANTSAMSKTFKRFEGPGRKKFVRFSNKSNTIRSIPMSHSKSAADALEFLHDSGRTSDLLLMVVEGEYFAQA